MPLDQRSVVPSIPGIPAWGAVAVAVGATVLGFVVDSFGGSELTSTFAALYIVGCLAAVLLVRHRGLFTAMAQPPLIVFFGVPIAYQFLTTDAGTSIKDIVLNVAIPLVNRFPLMISATLLVLLIGGARLLLDRKPQKPAKSPRRRAETKPPATAAASRERVHEENSDASPWRRPRSEDAPPRGARSARSDRRERDAEAPRRTRAQDAPRTRAQDAPRRAERSTSREADPSFGDGSGQHSRTSQPGRSPREQPRESSRRGIYAPTEATREPSHLREPATSYGQDRTWEPREHERRAYEPRTPSRRAGADNPALTPHPAPRVRYRDRD
ncbi:membrane protein [Rhodococcoides trifolii]|uniref:Membrane protein n=1 Tax=Rhodococcoides trifolii TaxID=908250 RepID=A0A917FZG3_9NOCA|nr:membrane protein [Rhodococcus trifolii]